MSSDQAQFEVTPAPSIEKRLQALDEAFLDLLRSQQSTSGAFDNGFDNGFDNMAD